MSSVTLRIADDLTQLSQTAAEKFVRAARLAVEARGRCAVALSGGATPRLLYSLLAQPPYGDALPWERLAFFWGDERCVPPDHPESNYRMAWESMLSRVPVPRENVFRVPTELATPEAIADSYETTLRSFFRTADGHIPRFDIVLLGMGPDGHTASLFPGNPTLEERELLVAPTFAEHLGAYRITVTLPLINQARSALFLVAGADKRAVLAAVLKGDQSYPAARVQPVDGELTWLIDRRAWGG